LSAADVVPQEVFLLTDIAQTFIDESRRLLTSDYLPKIERSLAGLGDEDIWWRPNAASNSIGNLLLHLCGNVRQWIVGGVGGREVVRDRQREFDERGRLPAAELLSRIRSVVAEADAVIAGLDAEALTGARQIQGYDVSVLTAVYHVVEHFSMHTGQIIFLSKTRGGRDLELWLPSDEPAQ
jgi:uncharacterized damage-inducible protein DinB